MYSFPLPKILTIGGVYIYDHGASGPSTTSVLLIAHVRSVAWTWQNVQSFTSPLLGPQVLVHLLSLGPPAIMRTGVSSAPSELSGSRACALPLHSLLMGLTMIATAALWYLHQSCRPRIERQGPCVTAAPFIGDPGSCDCWDNQWSYIDHRSCR